MTIQSPEGHDRGKFLIKKYPNAVKNMVLQRKDSYFQSKKYRALRNNCLLMDDYIDGKNNRYSSAISDISPQIIRRGYHEFTALFQKFFENDPIFSVRRGTQLSIAEERVLIGLLSNNAEKTYFRDRCLAWSIDHIVRYGTFATYSFAVDDYNANSLQTVKDDQAYDDTTYKQIYTPGEQAIVSMPIHPLNVIVDPNSNFMLTPDYKGFQSDICIAELNMLLENELYEIENLKKAIEACKAGQSNEYWYNGESERADYSKGHATICYMWTKLPFEGNEDDGTIYAIEEIGGEIIRIDENPLDGNTIPLAIGRVHPRQYDWFGNSPLVDKVQLHNLQSWTINSFVESTAKAMDRMVLYNEGDLDTTAINNRHQTGGLIPYRGSKTDLSQLMYPVSFQNNSFRDMDWLMQLARREDQDSSSMPNFNPQSEGGPTNKTLGGAQMMASIGEMKMVKHVNDMASGIKDVGMHQLSIMKNITPDDEMIKILLMKDMSLSVKTSNVFNYVRDGIDAQNRITQIINWMATGNQVFNNIQLEDMVKDWLRATTKREDIGSYYQEQQPSAQPPGMAPPGPQLPLMPPQMPQGGIQ